jgi:hypothetical protein
MSRDERADLLSGDEDLEDDDLGERDGLVGLPILGRLCVVDKDNEVILLALEVDLGGVCFSLDHDCGCVCGLEIGEVSSVWRLVVWLND